MAEEGAWPPSSAIEGFLDVVGHLLCTKKIGKHHDGEKAEVSLFLSRKPVSLSKRVLERDQVTFHKEANSIFIEESRESKKRHPL